MSDCDKCIDRIITSGYCLYTPTTAKLKGEPLCENGVAYLDYHICQNIKGKYHRNKINEYLGRREI